MEKFSPLSYKNNQLYFEGVAISEASNKIQTPFYLYGQKTLIDNYNVFLNSALKAKIKNPLICFAVKANGNKELLKLLAGQGCGADIVSGGELKRSLEAGISADKIVFSGVGKTQEEIELALKKQINSFNVESIEELEMINTLGKEMNLKARISFRLNPEVHAKTHPHISTGFKTHKFGILQEDIIEALKQNTLWTHSTLVGLSIHIGSQLTDLEATQQALNQLCDTVHKINLPLEFIDVGGGLGIKYNYEEDEKAASLDDYMNLISSTLKKYNLSEIKVLFEPGRIIMAKAGVFVTKVIRNKTSAGHHFVIVDGGMNDFVRPSLYNAYHEIFPCKKSTQKVRPTDIVGPICETADCFAVQRMLPTLCPGDHLVIADTGAYGLSMASNYNLRARPAEGLVTDKNRVVEINRPETYEQLR